MLILQDVRFLFGCAKYFACFSKLLPVKKLKVILWKDRKLQLLSIVGCQDISKNGPHSETMFLPQFTASANVTWKTIVFLNFDLWYANTDLFLTKDDHHHEPYSSLFCMLVTMYAMVKNLSFLLLHITVYFFFFFFSLISWTLNYKLKTGWT